MVNKANRTRDTGPIGSPNKGRHGSTKAQDPLELDPCLAAEHRLKTSFCSSRVKLFVCLAILMLTIVIAFAAILILIATAEEEEKPPSFFSGKTTALPIEQIQERNNSSFADEYNNTDVASGPTTKRPSGARVPVRILYDPKTTTSTTESPTSEEPDNALSQPSVPDPSPLPPYDNKTYDSCIAVRNARKPSGVYYLRPRNRTFLAYCDVVTSGGGWAVFHKRINGDVEFYHRNWSEYQYGFGDVHTSYWMGLENLYEMLPENQDPLTLRIELRGDLCSDQSKCSGQPHSIWWGEWLFRIGSADSHYVLNLSPRKRGNLSEYIDVFKNLHDGRPFTTIDRDNDSREDQNCAALRNYGGWWHADCGYTALNGMYGDTSPKRRYQYWYQQGPRISYYIHPMQSYMMVR